ncbi:hypothetical protein [Cupriavidus necator]|uniref:hypothetical protein n=1 Tax=Cupriavidus necator TaxID=106590 RepID=UPI0007C56351|nr:hypothetical protein [Cupriavidus necator]MDX6013429.1 hypothetical protein [Cupriavidus necator]
MSEKFQSHQLDIATLWESRDEKDWRWAEEVGYWKPIKPKNIALEMEMNTLDPAAVLKMDAHEWFDFLLHKYFLWKFTAPNRYATTTMHLFRQAKDPGIDWILDVKELIFMWAETNDIRETLLAANRILGLGTAGASGLVALLFPDKFGTVDQFVVKSLRKIPTLPWEQKILLEHMNPERLTIKQAVFLIEIMRSKARTLNQIFFCNYWTPRKIDKILWSIDRENG